MKNKLQILSEFENKHWVTKDNRKIKIKDLSEVHLSNIIKFMERKLEELEYYASDISFFQGEMAQDFANDDNDRQWENCARFRYQLNLFKCYQLLKQI